MTKHGPRDQPRDEEWLIIEWHEDAQEPAHYWFSNLPRGMRWKPMIDLVAERQSETDEALASGNHRDNLPVTAT